MRLLSLPERMEKERSYGLTSVVDFGIPVGELQHILNDYHQMIDFAKIGIGTAYVTPNLESKLALYKEFDIKPYVGGTFFEKCYANGVTEQFLAYLKDLEIEWVEISSGTIDIPIEERMRLVNQFAEEFHVVGEVGSKDKAKDMPLSQWREELEALIESGCEYVITEGRGSGTAGIYRSNGEVKTDLISEVIESVDWKKVIFEAPTPKQQMFFINELGPNANLGNVKIRDVLLLETQRVGLRSETFFMEENVDGSHSNKASTY